jgi:hypothetical protein
MAEPLTGPVTATASVATAAPTALEPDELDVVTRVVGSHLERFGQRNELTVDWRRP